MPPGTQRDKGGTADDSASTERARAGLFTGLTAYAMARGLTQAEILDCTGLALSEMLDPDARLPALALHRSDPPGRAAKRRTQFPARLDDG